MALSEWDRRQIEDVRQGRSKTLDLCHSELKLIPHRIYDLSHLERLDLRWNQIRVVPERIRELPDLRDLNLAWNPIEEVPDVPGLGLSWSAYIKCRESLSPENVVGIDVDIEGLPEPSRLCREIASLPNLRHLYVGLAATSGGTGIPKPTTWRTSR
jgi:Leucine-rich repeat (LRR) protein